MDAPIIKGAGGVIIKTNKRHPRPIDAGGRCAGKRSQERGSGSVAFAPRCWCTRVQRSTDKESGECASGSAQKSRTPRSAKRGKECVIKNLPLNLDPLLIVTRRAKTR